MLKNKSKFELFTPNEYINTFLHMFYYYYYYRTQNIFLIKRTKISRLA